jgi:hypothetical protein
VLIIRAILRDFSLRVTQTLGPSFRRAADPLSLDYVLLTFDGLEDQGRAIEILVLPDMRSPHRSAEFVEGTCWPVGMGFGRSPGGWWWGRPFWRGRKL